MSPWSTGKDKIEDFIAARKLTRLVGADAGVAGHMSRARQQLKSATLLLEQDPVTAYVVTYDAARHAAVALLAEQDLRVTAEGGHLAVEQAISVQFGGVFSSFTRLRRRRNELDDPVGPEDFADNAEAAAPRCGNMSTSVRAVKPDRWPVVRAGFGCGA